MGVNVVNRAYGDLRRLTWTKEGELVLTLLPEVDGDLGKLTWTI